MKSRFPLYRGVLRTCVTSVMLAFAVLSLTRPASRGAEPEAVVARTRQQIELLQQEKSARSPAERKLDSQLVYALRKQRQKSLTVAPGLPTLQPAVRIAAGERVLVDLRATVTSELLTAIAQGGGTVLNSFPRYQAVRATVPLELVLRLAERPDVRNVRPADEATTHAGPVTSEGDVTHQAVTIRDQFSVTGAGIKVGVMSDSVDHLAQSQAAGELPNVTIIPGEAGGGVGEGTAMLEIVHDLAPGAELYFATAFNGVPSFADNIRQLFAAGCRVIIDDVTYFVESPFQDGPIAQAVSEVSSNGALYFSSAGNWGNKRDETSGTWEGDFVDGGPATIGRGGRLHDFGGTTFNRLLGGGFINRIDLFWADPLGGSTNDYDVYLVDTNGNVVAGSANLQDGDDDPYETIPFAGVNQRVVIVKHSGAGRFIHLSNGGSRLQITTGGAVRGHNAASASNAFSVAATWVRSPAVPFTGGATNPVELFSADGPRQMFFNADGTPITPGDFSSTGGIVLQKPDITAADGVSTSLPGFSPFFGTSAAAPHAAAIAALVWSAVTNLTPDEIRSALANTALDIEEPGFDFDSGSGIAAAIGAFEFSAAPFPRVMFQSASFADAGGNGTIEINECGDVFVTLQNRVAPSGVTAVDVRGALRSSTSGVLVDPAPQFFGDLAPGALATNVTGFRISTTAAFICNRPALFELTIIGSNVPPKILEFQLQPTASSAAAPLLFTSSDTPLSVPDLSTNESSILVSGITQPLVSAKVALHVTHSFDSDLQISLIGPDGTTIDLTSNNGGSGTNYGVSCLTQTIFDDAATNSVVSGTPPFVGVFRPEQPLAAFSNKFGAAVNGAWRLLVNDTAPQDSGALQCWSLELTPVQCQPGSGQCLFPPSIALQPQSGTATNGLPAQLAVSAQGSPPLSYQWFFNQTSVLLGATNAELVFSNVTVGDAGDYFVVVTNPFGAVTSEVAQLTVVRQPKVLDPPSEQNITITNGSSITFSVLAEGTPPLFYQWLFEDSPLADATNSTLTLSNVTFSQSGRYSVLVSNPHGSTVSNVAVLTVVSPPIITQQPQNQTVLESATVTFNVTAIGTLPLAYQWYFNETNAIADATNATLVLSGVTPNQAGGYSVIVTNPYGASSSTEAELHVLQSNAVPVVLLAQPTNGSSYAIHQVPIVIEASASDPDGSVTQLVLFADGTPLTSSTASSLHFEWLDPNTGPTSLHAVATDNRGARGTSIVAQITVNFSTNAIVLIPTNAVWKYLDTGVDQGSAWRVPTFDDSGWSDGPAQLGYGDNDEATVVSFGPEETNKFITIYFRRSFALTDAASFTALSLRLLRDDGAVVYLNGVEVFRSNMPAGTIGYATLAVAAIAGAAENAFITTNISPALLVNGTNIAAVEIHQSSPTSSDISFALELSGQRSFAPHILVQPENQIVPEHTPAAFSVTAGGGKPLFYQWHFNATNALADATNSMLVLSSATRDDRGSYSVTISNEFGSIQSTSALLDVIFSNSLPQITLTAPTNGANLELNQIIVLQADANDADGSIVLVEFMADGATLGADAAAPYQFEWLDARAGLHVLSAVAIDNAGGRATSALAQIAVNFSTNAARLVSAGAVWKYLDTGVDQSNAWRALAFDDTTWSSGPAELGYGDDDEATVVGFGPDPNNKFATTYFRRSFVLTDAGSVTNLLVRLLRDDGAVIYLNETEVFRSNMPTGAVTFGTRPLASIGGAGETQYVAQAISSGLLRNGTNVVAVEVHQFNGNSSDVSFNLELRAERISAPVILAQPQNQFASTNATAVFSVSAVGTPLLTYQWIFNETNVLADATNTHLILPTVSLADAGNYFVVISNAFGVVTSAVAVLTVSETNAAPIIALTQPLDGAILPGHLPVVFEVNAIDPDGSIAEVEFFADGNRLGELAIAPYRFEWLDALPGAHQVWAVATDGGGASATSAVAQITVTAATNLTQFIARGAVWRYLDTGIDQGTAWRAPDFDAQSWPSGPAELGYGDASEGRPEATVVGFGPNANNKYITTYFRRAFVLHDVSTFTGLSLRLLRDDGAIVYLNGAEVFRSNMPTGEVAFTTLAAATVGGTEETAFFTNLVSSTLLLNGTNVVAVEVHQAATNSSDLSFDLELLAERGIAPSILTQPQSQTIFTGGTATFSVLAGGTEPLSYQWFFNGTNLLADATNQSFVLTNVSPALVGDYSVFVSNQFGAVLSATATLTLTTSNPPPIVSLIQPTNGQRFEAGVTILLEASATDPSGQVTNVEFFADGASLASDATASYQFAWTGALPGIHSLWAVASDDVGASSTSAVVHVLVNSPVPLAQTLVATGSVWKYLDTGVDLSNAWRAVDFEDSAWNSGPAELGYGDDDEATVLSFGTNASMKFTTYYFRHSFVATNVANLSQLDLRLRRDDGAVVYLNDVEVFRSNMPTGEITFATFAASVVSGAAETNFFSTNVEAALLIGGTNFLAVEVHQNNNISTDISFELELVGRELTSPFIVTQPQSQTVTNGETAQFSLVATGAPPLFYQWYFNFTNALPDATNATLVFTNANRNLIGSYVAAVSNAGGVVFSDTVSLNVVALPSNQPPTVVITSPLEDAVFFPGGVVSIIASANDPDGVVTQVEFFANDVSLAVITNGPFAFDWVNAPMGSHVLHATVTDNRGATGVSSVVHILVADAAPPPATNFTLIATGAVWKYLDTGVDQGTNWIALNFDDSSWASGPAELGYGDGAEGRPEATVLQFGPDETNKYPTYYFRHTFQVTNSAGYSDLALRVVRDDGVVVYLNGVEIFRDNLPPGPIAFTNFALNAIVAKNDETGFLTTNASPLLLHEGTNVVAVEIHQVNETSTDISFDLELRATQPIAPVIVVQPQDQVAALGQSAQFSVVAVGTAPLTYQWFFNTFIALPGATNDTLQLTNVQPSDEGSYSVVVANEIGSVTSESALLTIPVAPQIIGAPQNVTVAEGGTAQFSVIAVGAEPLSYRWLFNGTDDLANATNATLVLTNVIFAQSGTYAAVVSNVAGAVTSPAAALRVLVTTEITSVTRIGADVRLVFLTLAGLRYTVEFTDSLTPPQWIGVPGAIKLPGTGSPLTVDAPTVVNGTRLYRVRVE